MFISIPPPRQKVNPRKYESFLFQLCLHCNRQSIYPRKTQPHPALFNILNKSSIPQTNTFTQISLAHLTTECQCATIEED